MGRRFEAAARGEGRSASVTALGLTAAPANLPGPALDRGRGEREQGGGIEKARPALKRAAVPRCIGAGHLTG
jgi:hypothetical protein